MCAVTRGPAWFANMQMLLYAYPVQMDQLMLISANPLRSTLRVTSSCYSVVKMDTRRVRGQKLSHKKVWKILNLNRCHPQKNYPSSGHFTNVWFSTSYAHTLLHIRINTRMLRHGADVSYCERNRTKISRHHIHNELVLNHSCTEVVNSSDCPGLSADPKPLP